MTISASAEENDAGIIVFAFDYPGACGWSETEAAALDRLDTDLAFTCEWLDRHGIPLDDTLPRSPPFDPVISERVPTTGDPRECDSEGFFAIDAIPPSTEDVTRTQQLLEGSRADVLDLVSDLDDEVLDRQVVTGRRTIREILDHVAVAEHWYLTRVDPLPGLPETWQAYPDETFDRLAATRRDVQSYLRSVPGRSSGEDDRRWIHDGEQWSIRKVLRRLVWHELLHYKQLVRLLPKVTGAGAE